MTQKSTNKISNYLKLIVTLSLILIITGLSYWFSLQIQADQANLVNKAGTQAQVSFKNQTGFGKSPSIIQGVKEMKPGSAIAAGTSNLSLNQLNFEASNCDYSTSEASQNLKPDLKLSQDGLYGASKNDITLKYVAGNTLVYGQNSLDQATIDYMLCVMDITAKITSSSLEINLNQNKKEYLNTATRIIIYDNLSDYSRYYRQVYGQELGNATPWGLSESDTISTFLRLRNDDAIVTNQEFQDIRYRLTYNLAHEYFHHFFGTIRADYVPFIEEGLAVFIAGKVTKQVLGEAMSCTYRSSQAKLANQRTVDLEKFTILADEKDWYKSNNISELYADAYYFMSDLDQNHELASFIQKFLQNPERFENGESVTDLRPNFASNISNLITNDKSQCGN